MRRLAIPLAARRSAQGLVYGYRPKRLVIVSAPTRVSRIPVLLAKTAGLPKPAMKEFAKILDRDAGRPSAELDLVSTAPPAGIPGFLIHDLDDAVIPYTEAQALANAWPTLKVMTTKGKGHRDILSAPDVVRAIVQFVVPADASSSEPKDSCESWRWLSASVAAPASHTC